MFTILVTGCGGPAGRAVCQLLDARGYTVIGADMQPIALAGGDVYRLPAATDAAFLAALYQLVRQTGADLVIPTVSEELPIVADPALRFDPARLVVACQPCVLLANDKFLTYQQLNWLGLAVPRSILPGMAHTPEAIAQQIGWPCLSKPRVGRGGRGVLLHTPGDWSLMQALDERSILQEFAPGSEYAPNLYLARDGTTTVVVLEKTRLKGGVVGNALSVERVDAPDVATLAVAAAHALGLHGPVDIDIRRRANGTPVVLEINARFGANIAHAPEVLNALLADYMAGQTLAVGYRYAAPAGR